MKRRFNYRANLFLLMAFFACYHASGQTQTLGTRNNTVVVQGKMRVDSGLTPPKDTIASAEIGSIAYKGGLKIKGDNGKWGNVTPDSALYATRHYLDSIASLKAYDSGVVHKAQTETITGAKTFLQSPVVPTPALGDSSNKPATSAYVLQALYANFGRFQEKTLTLSGSGQDSVIIPQLAGMDLTYVNRSGIVDLNIITSGTPDSLDCKFYAANGSIKFGVSLRNGEVVRIRYQSASALAAISSGNLPTVDTYEQVKAMAATGTFSGFIWSNNFAQNPDGKTLFYISNGSIQWVVSTSNF